MTTIEIKDIFVIDNDTIFYDFQETINEDLTNNEYEYADMYANFEVTEINQIKNYNNKLRTIIKIKSNYEKLKNKKIANIIKEFAEKYTDEISESFNQFLTQLEEKHNVTVIDIIPNISNITSISIKVKTNNKLNDKNYELVEYSFTNEVKITTSNNCQYQIKKIA